jgi:hypothetical protein
MAELQPDDAPEEVPNWYLFEQNRAIQQKQTLIISLIGLGIAYVPAVVSAMLPATEVVAGGWAVSLLGMLISAIAILKLYARDPDSLARRICDRLRIATYVDAEAKIAEREIATDGGEEQ